MSKLVILGGIILILVGLALMVAEKGWINFKWLSWFGNLPGDIKIEKEKFKFYFPFTSMVIVSVVLSVLLRLIRKFWI